MFSDLNQEYSIENLIQTYMKSMRQLHKTLLLEALALDFWYITQLDFI